MRTNSHAGIPDELAALKRLSLPDQPTFRAAIAASSVRTWLAYFPFLYCFSRRRTLLWEMIDGSLCLYLLTFGDKEPHLAVYMPPLPFSSAALAAACRRVRSFNDDDRPCRIVWLEESQRARLERAGFVLEEREAEYIYDSARVCALEGKGFASLRKNVRQARHAPGLFVRPYRHQEDEEQCRKLLSEWKRTLVDEKDLELFGYWYQQSCVIHAAAFSNDVLRGEVTEIEGTIVGATFGGRINATYGNLFVSFSDHDYAALGYLMRYSFISNNSDIPYFNDSSDAGRPGIAHVKSRFNPVAMNQLYQAWES